MSEYRPSGIVTAEQALEAQMRIDTQRALNGPIVGNWAQTFSRLLGRHTAEPTITTELPQVQESSPEAATLTHLLDTRDRYTELTTDPLKERITGKPNDAYVDLNDAEVQAVLPSYQLLTTSLTDPEAMLVETAANGKSTLSANAKAIAAQLIENFHSQTIGSSESDLQSLFSHQLKLMYQGLKHDEQNPNIDMSTVRRIFSSARGQFAHRMAEFEEKRTAIESQKVERSVVTPRASMFERLKTAGLALGGAAMLAYGLITSADAKRNELPTGAQVAAATSTNVLTSVTETAHAQPDATATIDPSYEIPNSEPARAGSEDPMAALLPEGVLYNRENFTMTFFKGTDKEEVKSAYIERKFATWDEFANYVVEQESRHGRFQPETIDGILDVPANEQGGHILIAHAQNGSQKGPFEPIQAAWKAGTPIDGMEIFVQLSDSTLQKMRVSNLQVIAGYDATGVHHANPANYPVWFTDVNQLIGLTCGRDISGDGETDEYLRFNLEPVDNVEILHGYGLPIQVPKGTFSSFAR